MKDIREVVENLGKLGEGHIDFVYENGKIVGAEIRIKIRFEQPLTLSKKDDNEKQKEKTTIEGFEKLKKAGLKVVKEGNLLVVKGKTFMHRNLIKANGFKWNADKKLWVKAM